MAQDRQFLEKHGTQWRVQMAVPVKLRPIVGKAKLIHPLHTDSLANANRDKFKHVAAFKALLADAEGQLRRKAGKPTSPLVEDAMGWRAALAESEDTIHDGLDENLDRRQDEIRRSHGEHEAEQFVAIARGEATPLGSMVDAWLAHKPMKPRAQLDYRRAVTSMEAWLSGAKLPATLEGVTRKVAGRFISEALVAKGVHWKTANKAISCLSSYWRFLETKGHVRENVWARQSLTAQRKPADEEKRPFTDAEVAQLLTGDAAPLMRDAMKVAALSGMRIEEIAKLKVGSVRAGCFEVKHAKTRAGDRTVPVHSGLTEIVERRSAGKAATAYLFDEMPEREKGSVLERSAPLVKAFTRYRRAIGVDDVVEGARQSRIDFHSFRRWFSRKAGEALLGGARGFSEWTLADVMGHSTEGKALGMTMAVYPGPADVATKRACVEAVRLPDETNRPRRSCLVPQFDCG